MNIPARVTPAVRTAFVLAGGGSFGAIQVGMMLALAQRGVIADMVVGSSVGALNGAYYAAEPGLQTVERLADIWRNIRRQDVFPITLSTLAAFVFRRDFLVSQEGIRKLVRDFLPYRNLEEAKIPVHVVATDMISGENVVLSSGSAVDAIAATTAIPGAFAPVRYEGMFLSDGAVSSNTPVTVALQKGATRLIILPTGHSCARQAPPVGAIANAMHALTLLIARQLTHEIDGIPRSISYSVVPPLCPLTGSPYDFSMTSQHIERAYLQAEQWIAAGGLELREVPLPMRAHKH